MTNVTLAAMLGGREILVVLTTVFVLAVVPVAVVAFVVYFVLRRGQGKPAPTKPVPPAAAAPQSPLQPLPAGKTEVVPRKCPQCGAELKPDVPEGLCPACLLQRGIATEGQGGGGTTATFTPPPVAELQRLFPQLEIFECLGRGGMGAVYRARQPRLDRLVALKILAPEKQSDPQFAERFEREARALARLNHPDIVAVYDFGEVEGRFYLLMEFVDGLSLRQLLQAGKMTPEQALTIVPKICEALQFAHEHGIVHRDIKPENILLDKAGRVKIADFGIAKITGLGAKDLSLTGTGDVVGTPHYMAPEQIEKPLTVDHRADIYSLGVVFYEMLTGELPLGKFQPPSKKVQVDVRLDEVVLHALEKEPERRYQQVSEVKSRVETIVHTAMPRGAEQKPAVLEGQSQRGTSVAPSRLRSGTLAGFAVFLAITAAAICVTLLLPRIYAGIARVKLPDDNVQHIQAECAEILSSDCLEKTASDLNLAQRWNQKYQITTNNNDAILELLRARVVVTPIKDTALAEIQVYDESPREAAEIANKLSEVYCAFHGGQRVSQAIQPLTPFRPNLALNISIGALVGLVAGIFTGLTTKLFWLWRLRKTSPAGQKPDHFWRWFAVALLVLISVPVVIAIISLLAAIAIPNFVRARQHALVVSRQSVNAASNNLPTRGLVAWWHADGNADDSANDHNGVLENVGFTDGVIGQAFAFDPDSYPRGTYTGVKIPDDPAFALTNALSIECWIRPRGNGYIIFWRGDHRPGLDPYSLDMPGDNRLRFCICDETGNAAELFVPLAFNKWWHIAATFNNGAMKLYTNGVLAAEKNTGIRPFANLIPSESPGVGIGNLNDGGNNFPFIGDIDEVALYNRALSASEIKAAYNHANHSQTLAADAETWSPAPGEKPDLQNILNSAKSLTAEGSYEESLQRYLWYFDHSRNDASQRGVRLSFALSDWVELGRRYPKARQALAEIRDADARKFSDGEGYADLFQEVAGINQYLDDGDATLALFKSIAQHDPKLAGQCYPYASDLLVSKGDYETCRRFMGDPQQAFARIRDGWQRMKQWEQQNAERNEAQKQRFQEMAKTNSLYSRLPSFPTPPPFADNHFIAQTRQLIEILVATGDKPEAEKIQAQAVALLNVPELQSAVNDAETHIQKIKAATAVDSAFGPSTPPTSTNAVSTDQVLVEHAAMHMLAAIRDKDEAALKELATDERVKGWRAALPEFAFELREKFHQLTGKPFDLHASESLVRNDMALVKCDGPVELNGKYLALFFVKTSGGWKNCYLHSASLPSQPLAVWWKQFPAQRNSAAAETESEDAITSTAQKWLALIDAGNYSESWKTASALFQGGVTEPAWENAMNAFRKPLGVLLSRRLKSAQSLTQLPGAPDGHYVVMQFESSFTNKKSGIETVTFMLEKDGQWRSAGYYIN